MAGRGWGVCGRPWPEAGKWEELFAGACSPKPGGRGLGVPVTQASSAPLVLPLRGSSGSPTWENPETTPLLPQHRSLNRSSLPLPPSWLPRSCSLPPPPFPFSFISAPSSPLESGWLPLRRRAQGQGSAEPSDMGEGASAGQGCALGQALARQEARREDRGWSSELGGGCRVERGPGLGHLRAAVWHDCVNLDTLECLKMLKQESASQGQPQPGFQGWPPTLYCRVSYVALESRKPARFSEAVCLARKNLHRPLCLSPNPAEQWPRPRTFSD